jgi:autotransporter-associated beta strand protein
VTLSATATINTGGILVTPNVGNKNETITGGVLGSANNSDIIISDWDTSGQLIINSVLAGTNNTFTKSGPGTVVLGAVNTFNGATSINQGTVILSGSLSGNSSAVTLNSGGTLKIGSNNNLGGAMPMTLNGGIFNAGGFSLGSFNGTAATAGIGVLSATSNSTIDFGSGATNNVIAFSGANTTTPWAGGLTLTIANWNGTLGSPDGANAGGNGLNNVDALFIGTTAGLTNLEIGDIVFSIGGIDYGALQASNGEVYASSIALTSIPEPGTWAMAVAGFGLLLCGQRVRRKDS